MPRKQPDGGSFLVVYTAPNETTGSVLVSHDPLSSEEVYGHVIDVIRKNLGLGEDAPICVTNVMACAWEPK